ncbi:MAG: cyclic nucleotide-binding domain-containing protein [Desulfobulbaceae bacterium]|nr:cyclic nucleotide-binding domain-containing protein [Desulfobulbaceae bacterium]
MVENSLEREVIVLMTDMVQYSRKTAAMSPEQIKDFLIDYHANIYDLVDNEESYPLEIEPSGGDGSLVIFEKRPGEDKSAVCSRALDVVVRLAQAIRSGHIQPTRIGLLLGDITEAKLGSRIIKFGSSFAVANRLEELCGYFETTLLMDREVAKYQKGYDKYILAIGKVSLSSVLHPINMFTLCKPGIQEYPAEVDEEQLLRFVTMKNEAMELFAGNLQLEIEPDFPKVREMLLEAQNFFLDLTGKADTGTERILEYIRETPFPASDFDRRGMKLMEKSRDSLGERIFHLSKQLLKAMNPEFYHALVVDTKWEKHFRLEWYRKGEIIIQIGSSPDGVYYLDSGVAETIDEKGEWLSTMESGTIFGEMAYLGGQQKRTATVLANTDIVLRKISTEALQKLPAIVAIFERIALARKDEIEKGGKFYNQDEPHASG